MKASVLTCLFFFIGCCSVNGAPGHEVQITETKVVQLTHFPQADAKLIEAPRADEKDYSKGISDFPNLGMAGVPVLDQGQYGTCVTFASTAALDAILGQGDFISQQCSLDLDYGMWQNYWDGAYYPSQIIDPLKSYGVVKKSKCPRQYPVPYAQMSATAYGKIKDVAASAKVKQVQLSYSPSVSLPLLKKAIDDKHRVLIAFVLDGNSSEAVRGFDVKVAGKKYQGGLWACKQGASQNHCVASNAGHEVLVVGYDDKQQLLRIRNSWNTDVGMDGEYFMTYKFFETMGADQTEIW